jgi:hypothetical protein
MYYDSQVGTDLTANKEFELTKAIQSAILREEQSIQIEGRTIHLPQPQRSGTMTQNSTYAYIQAKEIYQNEIKSK